MDVLRLPVVGPLLRWRHVRVLLQAVLLVVAGIVVGHGLFGTQVAPRNLATVLTSIHWRGFLVLALVVVGNLFCTACPMILVRDAGRRLVPPRFSWPRRLRRKWVGLGLLVLVLFSYELFDLWEQPSATAWLVLGYFGLALLVDLQFKGASFCKYVCPIGQFNFIGFTMAPTELQVRDTETCRGCRTFDCIKGRRTVVEPIRVVQRGCELGLFLPGKVGNLDCTLCLDCVRACPHDNIALATRVPGLELLDTRRRSGIGRLSGRPDIAALAVVFAFAALLNAFAMTAPAFALEHSIAGLMHVTSEAVVLGLLYGIALLFVPAAMLLAAAAATRAVAGTVAQPLGGHGKPVLGGAHSFRARCLAGTLRVPFVDRHPDRRPGYAERSHRSVWLGGVRRASVALGRDAGGVRAADPDWCRLPRNVRIHRSRSGDLAARLS